MSKYRSTVSFEARLKVHMKTEAHEALERGSSDLYDRVQSKWERYLFEAILNAVHGNKSKAATVLGITRNTLSTKLKSMCKQKIEWTVK